MTTKNILADVWGTLSRKVLSSVLVDDGAVIPVNDIIGGHHNWIAPKERPIWIAVRQCLDANTPPTIEAVTTRVNGGTEPGYIQVIANLFDSDDNRNLVYHTQQLRDIGILASLRQLGRELSDFNDVEKVGEAVNKASSELGGLLAGKTNRSPLAADVSEVIWGQLETGNEAAIPTGFKWFDELTGGLWTGMNYWIVAPYKSGKTTVMRNGVINTAQAGHGVGVFCAEGSREMFTLDCQAMIATGILADQGLRNDDLRLDGLFIRRFYHRPGVFKSHELNAVNAARQIWEKLPIQLWDGRDAVTNLTTLRYLIKRSKLEYGLRVFWIDYSQLFGEGKTIYDRQSETSKAVQDIAATEGVAICMLAQQNEEQVKNGNEGHSPGVKGGGDAAAAADFLLIPKIEQETPFMELRLKLSRHTRPGKGHHYINKSSGLMMDKWIDVSTIPMQ